MIRSFKCKETARIWGGLGSLKIPKILWERALRKLRQLDAATVPNDLKIPPANHLEVLKGSRRGQMSIRINQQWRICFKWKAGEVMDVEIIDYH